MTAQVLVIEAYADLRSAIGDTLQRGHYECDCVATEDDAIAMLRNHRYSAILLAPRLPIAKDRVIEFLEHNQPEQMSKVILMTDPDDGEPALPALMKPFNSQDLLRKLPRR